MNAKKIKVVDLFFGCLQPEATQVYFYGGKMSKECFAKCTVGDILNAELDDNFENIGEDILNATVIAWEYENKSFRVVVDMIVKKHSKDDIDEEYDDDDWEPTESDIQRYLKIADFAEKHPETNWSSEDIGRKYGLR